MRSSVRSRATTHGGQARFAHGVHLVTVSEKRGRWPGDSGGNQAQCRSGDDRRREEPARRDVGGSVDTVSLPLLNAFKMSMAAKNGAILAGEKEPAYGLRDGLKPA